jgi:hypothetical protein
VNDVALLLDLDETLIEENSAAVSAFEASAAFALAHDRRIGQPVGLIAAARARARELWVAAPTYDYCRRIGISSTEGLWCRFEGNVQRRRYGDGHRPTAAQPGQVPWRRKVSTTARSPTLLLNVLLPNVALDTASLLMWSLPFPDFKINSRSGSSRTARHVFRMRS